MEGDLLDRIDRAAGKRNRSQFVRTAVEAALDRDARATSLLSALGAIADQGHGWDADPATWVRTQRRADPGRVG